MILGEGGGGPISELCYQLLHSVRFILFDSQDKAENEKIETVISMKVQALSVTLSVLLFLPLEKRGR